MAIFVILQVQGRREFIGEIEYYLTNK